MPKTGMTLLLAALTLSLNGCATNLSHQGATGGLAARCGHPTNWTKAQKAEVAAALTKNQADPGIALLGLEWDRETAAIRICRGDK